MGQCTKCDECGKIGVTGETWVTVSVAPFYIRGNQQFYGDDCTPIEVSTRSAAVCSPTCAVDRLRRGFEDLVVYAEQMHEGVSLLGDELLAQTG